MTSHDASFLLTPTLYPSMEASGYGLWVWVVWFAERAIKPAKGNKSNWMSTNVTKKTIYKTQKAKRWQWKQKCHDFSQRKTQRKTTKRLRVSNDEQEKEIRSTWCVRWMVKKNCLYALKAERSLTRPPGKGRAALRLVGNRVRCRWEPIRGVDAR